MADESKNNAVKNLRTVNAWIARDAPLLGRSVVIASVLSEEDSAACPWDHRGARGTVIDFSYSERTSESTEDVQEFPILSRPRERADGELLNWCGWLISSGRYTVRLEGAEDRVVILASDEVESEESARLRASAKAADEMAAQLLAEEGAQEPQRRGPAKGKQKKKRKGRGKGGN